MKQLLQKYTPVVIGFIVAFALLLAAIQLPQYVRFTEAAEMTDAYHIGIGVGMTLGLFITAIGSEIKHRIQPSTE